MQKKNKADSNQLQLWNVLFVSVNRVWKFDTYICFNFLQDKTLGTDNINVVLIQIAPLTLLLLIFYLNLNIDTFPIFIQFILEH